MTNLPTILGLKVGFSPGENDFNKNSTKLHRKTLDSKKKNWYNPTLNIGGYTP